MVIGKWIRANWGLVFIVCILIIMFIVGFMLDPRGTPGGSFDD